MNPMLIALGFLFDFIQNQRQNTLAAGREAATTEGVRAAEQGVTDAARLPFTFNLNGQRVGPQGEGLPFANFEKYFKVGTNQLNAYDKAMPTNTDVTLNLSPIDFASQMGGAENILGASRSRLNDLFSGARLAPGALRAGVNLPSADLSDVLNADLAGIGAASRANTGQARADIAARADQFGGLENAERYARSVDFEQAAARGTAAAQAQGENRARETGIEQFNASTIAGLNQGEASINAALAQAMMGQEGQLTAEQMALIPALLAEQRQRAGLQVDVDTGNITRTIGNILNRVNLVGASSQDKLSAFMEEVNKAMQGAGFEQQAAAQTLNAELGLGQILSPGMNQNMISLLSALGLLQDNEPDQPSGFGISTPFGGFSTSG